MKDVFAIQGDVAQQVADALQITLLDEEQSQLAKQGTANPDAYNLYLKGRYFWSRFTKEDHDKSKTFFEQAIALDPTYALAYAELAELAYWQVWLTTNISLEEVYARSLAMAEKALALDDTLGAAYATVAYVKTVYEWDWAGADRAFTRALALNPDYVTALANYAQYFLTPVMERHDDALALLQRAEKLDPLSVDVGIYMGWVFNHSRRYDQSLVAFRKVLEITPNNLWGYMGIATNYLYMGRYDEAITVYQKMVDLGDGLSEALLGTAYAMAGREDEAQQILKTLHEKVRHEYITPVEFAFLYMALGETDQAFAWLQKGYEERAPEMPFLKVMPILDPLRSDPRFTELLQKMDFPTD